MSELNNKRVLITGGASGLGRALALQYAQQGCRVCITDLNDGAADTVCAELKALGASALYVHADVTSEQDLQYVADQLVQQWGGLDILVNNAGVAAAGAIEDLSLTDWEWILNINLLGVVRGCKVFVPLFKQQHSGHIINIASMAGLLDVPQMASYNVSKAAVVALSGTLEQELRDEGIVVSVVCPSFFKTNLDQGSRTNDPRLKKQMARLLESGKLSADQVAAYIVDHARLGHFFILPHKEGQRIWLLKQLLPHSTYVWLFARSVRGMKPRKSA